MDGRLNYLAMMKVTLSDRLNIRGLHCFYSKQKLNVGGEIRACIYDPLTILGGNL